MWEWLNSTVRELVRLYRINSSLGDKDDISQEVLMYLNNDIPLAKKIYEEENKCLLYTIIKKIIFRESAKSKGFKRDTLTHYNRIISVCEKYNIEPTPENAYRIAEIINESNYSIVYVKTVLSSKNDNIKTVSGVEWVGDERV